MACADGKQQDGRHDVPRIHRRPDESHQSERPDHAHDRRYQGNDHSLQGSKCPIVQIANHRKRKQEEPGHAPRVDQQPVQNGHRPGGKNLES